MKYSGKWNRNIDRGFGIKPPDPGLEPYSAELFRRTPTATTPTPSYHLATKQGAAHFEPTCIHRAGLIFALKPVVVALSIIVTIITKK